MITEYVLGFAFNEEKKLLLLIVKQRPEWQAGLLNGIGGHIEPNDVAPHAAMTREFREETGIETEASDWDLFAEMSGYNWRCRIFRMFSDKIYKFEQKTDEELELWEVDSVLISGETIPNLKYLIPMALDSKIANTVVIYR